jgi:hypothetical protein
VVERPRVDNRCLNTHIIFWILMLDKNEDQMEPLEGSMEPSKGKGGESVVAILRFSIW